MPLLSGSVAPPGKLRPIEKLVVGGWVLERDEHHEPAGAEPIATFIAENFRESVSPAWVTCTMKALHLTSHRDASKPLKYRRADLAKNCHRFVSRLRDTIDDGYRPSQVVAIDNVRFTHPQVILRSYMLLKEGNKPPLSSFLPHFFPLLFASIPSQPALFKLTHHPYRGQPSLWEHEWRYHTVLYEGLCMDGTVLPPIIFTNCPNVPKGVEQGFDGKVIYLPNLSQPSGDMTLRWLDEVAEHLEDNPIVVHDSGPEYIAREVQEDFEQRGIHAMRIPAAGGTFINPCDNPFNSGLKTAYYKEQQRTYEDKLHAIFKAYYSPSEETLVRYFEHVGWRGERLTKRGVQHLLSEGYRPGKRNQKLSEEMRKVYRGWQKNLRVSTLEEHTTFVHRIPPHSWHTWP